MSGPILRNRVMEYVLDETPPETPHEDPFGPFGQCIRATHPDGYGLSSQHRCREAACSDLGWCADHLAELQAT